MLKLKALFLFAAVISYFLMMGISAQGQTVVVDQGLGTQVSSLPNPLDPANPLPVLGGALVIVDGNGNRTMLSDFGNGSQGPVGGGQLKAIVWVPSGLLGLGHTILALDSSAGTNHGGALFAVNPFNGNRLIFNDFGSSSQGPTGVNPVGVIAATGLLGLGTNIYVIDNRAGTNGAGAIFRINPATAQRTLLSDFGNSNQGPLGLNPVSIAIAPAGLLALGAELIVLDDSAGLNGVGEVFAVDSNGNRTVLSDLGNATQGYIGVAPQNVAVISGLLGLGTQIYVVDNQAGTNGNGTLVNIMASGTRNLVTDFGSPDQGAMGSAPDGISSGAGGDLLVTDSIPGNEPTQSKLLFVTPNNGQRSILTNCNDTSLGPCHQMTAITQVP